MTTGRVSRRRSNVFTIAVVLMLLSTIWRPVPAAAAPVCGTGWNASYFNSMDLSGTPALERCDPTIDFTWPGSPGAGVNADAFSVRWTRTLTLLNGTYRFTATADDGMRVFLDGQPVIDRWNYQSPTTFVADRTVTAGQHTVVVEFFEGWVDARAFLSVTPIGGDSPANLIRNGDLSTGAPVPDCLTDGGWGTNTRTSSVSPDVPAGSTGRSWQIVLSNYSDGDAKAVPSSSSDCTGAIDPTLTYRIGVSYKSTVPSNSIPVFIRTSGQGWTYWTTLTTLPAVATWTKVDQVLPVLPAGATQVTFGVAAEGNGTLLTTGYSLGVNQGGSAPTVQPPSQGLDATGRWTVASSPMPLRTVHSTVLRDGRVLMIAGSGNDVDAFKAGTFTTYVWNPTSGAFTQVPTPIDMFCSGHVTLPDGRVLIAGGTTAYPGVNGATGYQGSKKSYIFDPATNSFSAVNDMQQGHWYPTLTKIENGNVWAAGGYNETGGSANNTEMFDSVASRWLGVNEVEQTYQYWGTYPHMFLLADDRLFYSGGHTFGGARPGTGAAVYDWRTKQIGDIPGLRDKDRRDQAGTVLLPPAQAQRFLIAGGGGVDQNLTPTSKVDIVNMNDAAPTYRPAPDLPGGGRMYLNLTTLPDRTVLASNGGTQVRGGDVLAASIFHPDTNSWTTVNPDPIGRNYHSSSLLLPDGRMVVIGSNPADGSFEQRISVYEPPYLFKGGTKPTVGAPTTATYGQSVPLTVSGTVVTASLMSPDSATHQTDTNARLVDLPITGTGGARTATVPTNHALLPPGPYMLTVLDSNGVPSVAKWITIR